MKKAFSLILVMVIVLSLCACAPQSGSASSAGSGFQVGYARETIMPEGPVPLAGYGNTDRRLSSGFLDYLYLTCTAITDADGNTLLMFSGDTIGSTRITELRPAVHEATGIPEDHILLNSSHTHSGPDMGKTEFATINAYIKMYVEQGVKAAVAALEDRKPAKMYYATIETEGLNFVRHYVCVDGSYMGDNFGDQSLEAVKHTSEVDPTMHLIKFDRGEGNKPVLLMNWRAHATITGGASKTDISADFIGSTRDYLEKELGCLFAYFQGAAGNVNPRSRIPEEDCTRDYKLFGQQLGSFAIKALENTVELEAGPIRVNQLSYTANVNHTKDHLLLGAKEVAAYWEATGDSTGCKEMGAKYGIRGHADALGIVRNAARPMTEQLELDAYTIGELAFVTAPNELFDTNAMYVEANSPFTYTMVFGYSNGSKGYMPSALAWEYTSYETDQTHFEPGTAEKVQDKQLELLQQLYDTK